MDPTLPRAASGSVGDADSTRGGWALSGWAHAARCGSSTPACASRWTCASMCRSSRWAIWRADGLAERRSAAAGARAASRRATPSGRPSTRSCCVSVREHRSTIVFVNNRRSAERVALRLNELAAAETDDSERADGSGNGLDGAALWGGLKGVPVQAREPLALREIARAHHGSLSREERTTIEEQLKAGELPCLVATSSLELGIDMGAVDLVLADRVAQVGGTRFAAHRACRPRRRRCQQGAHLPQVPWRLARVRGAFAAHARRRDRADGRAA